MKRKRNVKVEATTSTNTESVVFDTKAFEKALLAEVKAAGGTKAFYAKHDIIKELLKTTFQALLNAEMEEHLGYEKHASEGHNTGNSRNGKGAKKVRGDFGEVEIFDAARPRRLI